MAKGDAKKSAKATRRRTGNRKDAEAERDRAQAERDRAQAERRHRQRIFSEFLAASELTDALSQLLVMTVGSTPSVAVANGMLAANAAEGIMYHNAVAHQQKTNLLGMAMTAKCVRYMLDGRPASGDGYFDDLVDEIVADTAEET